MAFRRNLVPIPSFLDLGRKMEYFFSAKAEKGILPVNSCLKEMKPVSNPSSLGRGMGYNFLGPVKC